MISLRLAFIGNPSATVVGWTLAIGMLSSSGCSSGDDASRSMLDASADRSTSDVREEAEGSADAPGEQAVDAPSAEVGSTCAPQSMGPASAGAAASAGFSGTEMTYASVYAVSCGVAADCTNACVAAGGTAMSCSGGSLCAAGPTDAGSRCIPPAYWLNPAGALSGSGSTGKDAQLTLIDTMYQDSLLMTDFGISLPAEATVVGIQFDVSRNADQGEAVDDSVRVLRGGMPVSIDHAQSTPWPKSLAVGTYGGPNDTWGIAWRAADVTSSGFGVSIAPRFTATTGNDRAHVDSVKATVYYVSNCE
jgi:hypothetical protein